MAEKLVVTLTLLKAELLTASDPGKAKSLSRIILVQV